MHGRRPTSDLVSNFAFLLPLNSASSLISSQKISTYHVALSDSNADQIRGLQRQLLEMKL